MTPRIERLPSGGYTWRDDHGALWGPYADITCLCADWQGTHNDILGNDRAARLLRYLHRYDDWCAETPTTEGCYWSAMTVWNLDHVTKQSFNTVEVVLCRILRSSSGEVLIEAPDGACVSVLEFEFYYKPKWMLARMPTPPKVAGPMMTTKEGE